VAGLPTDVEEISAYLDATIGRIVGARDAPASWWPLLKELEDERLPRLDQLLLAAVRSAGTGSDHHRLPEIALGSGRLHRLVLEGVRDVVAFMPWLGPQHAGLADRFADLPVAPPFADLARVYDVVAERLGGTDGTRVDVGPPGVSAALDGVGALLDDVASARALAASIPVEMD